MKIRTAKLSDIEILNSLNSKYFGENRDYTEEINSSKTIVLVGEDDSKIIGISGLKIKDWNNTGLLLNIFIHPDFRKNGLGSELLKAVIREAKNKKLRCLIAEAPSEGNAPYLFLKNGLHSRKKINKRDRASF